MANTFKVTVQTQQAQDKRFPGAMRINSKDDADLLVAHGWEVAHTTKTGKFYMMAPDGVKKKNPVIEIDTDALLEDMEDTDDNVIPFKRDRSREDWLTEVVEMVSPWFEDIGMQVPKYRVTTGFLGRGQMRGMCTSPKESRDYTTEIEISQTLDDPLEVTVELMHELVHAVAGPEHKHDGVFRAIAKGVGLLSPIAEAKASDVLLSGLELVIAEVGPYPHAKINAADRPKQTKRMLKCECPSCGYLVYLSQKWASIGTPLCPTDKVHMVMADEPGKDGDEAA